MTDTAVDPGAWVPRLGDSTIPSGHAELIRGLYRLAAWVADHTEVPAPDVHARFWPDLSASADEQRLVVDDVADAFGAEPRTTPDRDFTAYEVEARLGPLEVDAYALLAPAATSQQMGGGR